MSLKEQIAADMKAALKAHDSVKLSTVRMLMAAIKQKEVDERVMLDDAAISAVVSKLIKQRKDSAEQFRNGGRQELAAREEQEIKVLAAYLPQQMSQDQIAEIVEAAVAKSGLQGMGAMGAVMALVKPQVAGKADMSLVSKLVRARLTA